jgi:polyribonucleotide nucleotidyltransferase
MILPNYSCCVDSTDLSHSHPSSKIRYGRSRMLVRESKQRCFVSSSSSSMTDHHPHHHTTNINNMTKMKMKKNLDNIDPKDPILRWREPDDDTTTTLSLQFSPFGKQADTTVLGQAGATIVLTTLSTTRSSSITPLALNNDASHSSRDVDYNNNNNRNEKEEGTVSSSSSLTKNDATFFLTVEYRQRYAAVGQIPDGKLRRDNYSGRMTTSEILASRIIDRSLRPLLLRSMKSKKNSKSHHPNRYHVHCSVQSCQLWPSSTTTTTLQSNTIPTKKKNAMNAGYVCPISTALNAASAAMVEHLHEPVAAITLGILSDHTIVKDPGPSIRNSTCYDNNSYQSNHLNTKMEDHNSSPVTLWGELVYVGTRTKIIMLEWKTIPHHGSYGLSESILQEALQMGAQAIQPILDTIETLRKNNSYMQQQEPNNQQQPSNSFSSNGPTDENNSITSLRESLGLPPLFVPTKSLTSFSSIDTGTPPSSDTNAVPTTISTSNSGIESSLHHDDTSIVTGTNDYTRTKTKNDVVTYCNTYIGPVLDRFFGYDGKNNNNSTNRITLDSNNIATSPTNHSVQVHSGSDLWTKQQRGIREQIVTNEIYHLLDEYSMLEEKRSHDDRGDDPLIVNNDTNAINKNNGSILKNKSIREIVRDYLFRTGLYRATSQYGTRSDGRGNPRQDGWCTIRPIQLQVPALPDNVHGSSLFARGDTQVLCTVTLGPPRDGLPHQDPYQPNTTNPNQTLENTNNLSSSSSYGSLPVGSLRFLRTQEALMSDLNSRKSKADKELTGDSGILSELQNAYLHYDFPSYATGSVPEQENQMTSIRRSIGHGILAERAILPVIPEKDTFPYAIRMTSEVTDSSGSSSMATICGTTLALYDAGVPIYAPVAGVSVGLVMDIVHPTNEEDDESFDDTKYSLLLDITGTEDHVSRLA